MVVFNVNFSGFYFNIVRTLATIPVVPLLIAWNTLLVRPKTELMEEEENAGEQEAMIPNSSNDKVVDEAPKMDYNWEDTERQSGTYQAAYAANFQPPIDYSTTTPGTGSSTGIVSSTESLVAETQMDEALPATIILTEGEEEHVCSGISTPEKKNGSGIRCGYCSRCMANCAATCGKSSRNSKSAASSFLGLSLYKLHPNARWPVFISTVSGCVRQMVVPIALMFTSANAGEYVTLRVCVLWFGVEKRIYSERESELLKL